MLLELGKLIAQLGFTVLGGVVAAQPEAQDILRGLANTFGVQPPEGQCDPGQLCEVIKNDPDALVKLSQFSAANTPAIASCVGVALHYVMAHFCGKEPVAQEPIDAPQQPLRSTLRPEEMPMHDQSAPSYQTDASDTSQHEMPDFEPKLI